MKAHKRRVSPPLTAVALCVIGSLAACAPHHAIPPPQSCAGLPGGTKHAVQLLFGRAIGTAGEVGEDEWRDFMASVITPAFPDGLTVIDAQGQWRDPATGVLLGERAKMVFIVVADASTIAPQLDAVATAYKARFRQDSVGIVITPACAAFR